MNRSEESLWGFVSNGLQLRILRDNQNLVRQAYVEFDLETMMEGETYSDFVILWLLCHQSRVEAEQTTEFWLEKWSCAAQERGVRALEHLREGVEDAISLLGSGFLAHRDNRNLKENLRSGLLNKQDYYRQLLRLVYRLLFLFVAEDRTDENNRSLLFDPAAQPEACKRYTDFYSTSRLRRLAERRHGSRHSDLYATLRLMMQKLGSDTGCGELGLPALGSFLFSEDAIVDLNDCEIANHALLDAIRALAFATHDQARRQIDYKNLGSEELGSVYESLLELHPEINVDAATLTLSTAAGHERKTTGSYYTPDSLVQCLLDSALDPVIDERVRTYSKLGYTSAEEGILDLKVCDPACGSGHFLIATAHRLAKRVAAVLTGEDEPSPDAVRHALRKVVGRCLYGVDVNPMAVELCKVSLWMEALDPGKPLSFLDHHIRCGNSLLGTTPELISEGIPDDAFKAIEGDDKKACAILKRLNALERRGFGELFVQEDNAIRDRLRLAASAIDDIGDDRPEDVHRKEAAFSAAQQANDFLKAKALSDLWCAAFVIAKRFNSQSVPVGITTRHLRDLPPADALESVFEEARQLADSYRFFHWHIAYPEVFCEGGFDVVLGNPPWVRQELLKPFKQLLVVFHSFTSTADSSVYFLERGLEITRREGLVAMLTPNKWLRASYAEKLRKQLRQCCRMKLLIDFGHSRTLFHGTDTFPAAVVFQPVAASVPEGEILRFVQANDSDRGRHPLPELIRLYAIPVPHNNLRPDRWHLEDLGASDLLNNLMTTGQPLEHFLRSPILSGVKTGFNQAFYVETPFRDAMVAADPASESIFKKFLRGRDIKRWVPRWDDQWHIVIPSSQNRSWPWSAAGTEAEAEAIFALTYPSVHAHLKQFEEKLRARHDKGDYWWELRSCDYYEDFEKPKIIVQCIAYYSQFAFDSLAHYVNNKVIVIPTDDFYVLGILNSRVIWWIVNRTFQHMKDEGLSVDVQFLKRLPVPTALGTLRSEISRIASALIGSTTVPAAVDSISALEIELNELVDHAFALTTSERKILVSSLPPRDPLDVAMMRASEGPLSVGHPPGMPPVRLLLPSLVRYPQPDSGVYMLRVILSMLLESGGSIDMERLMNACSLLAMPDTLETYGARIEADLAHEWRRRFSDQFKPDLFLAKLDDLVQRGEIKLVREDTSFKVIRVNTADLARDSDIEFDARFALRVSDSLAQTEREAFTPMATHEEIEARSSRAA